MKLRVGQKKDFENIALLYQRIIDGTPNLEHYVRWRWNFHPSEALIKEYLDNEELYVLMDGEDMVAAMAVTMQQGEDYHAISWSVSAADDEVAVVHILGVNPKFQGRGIGHRMIDEAIQLAKDNKKLAVRLDALASNTPAQKLYLKKGFVYQGTQNLYASNTGWIDFYFYEYKLYQ